MINKPLISIITPVYNAEKYINQCIESVLSQSYSNWELLLIDDCSIDHSVERITPYLSDSRIKLFRSLKNIGPAEIRNIGLNNVTGKYVTFLDSDDFWAKEKLENQINFMLKNNLSMSHGSYYFCNMNGDTIKKVIVSPKIDYFYLLRGNQFKIMTVMLKTDLIGTYRFENIKHEDYAFFLECLKRTSYSFTDVEKLDSFCRIGSRYSVSGNKLKSAIWTWNIYKKHQKLNFLKVFYYFIHYIISGFIKYRKK